MTWRARLAGEGRVILLAVQLLTRLPVPPDPGYTPGRLAATPRWYPLVGILVGALAGAVYLGAAVVLTPLLAALLATLAGVLATGAFHEDGLADTWDGLGGGATRDRALEIMRDSRIGSYGALALGLVLATKVAALAALPAAAVPGVLIAGHAASRMAVCRTIATAPYARDAGTGAPLAAGIGWGGQAVALAPVGLALLAAAVAVPPLALGAGVGMLVLAYAAMRRALLRKLGGYTGDGLGAVQQVSELGFYLGVAACL